MSKLTGTKYEGVIETNVGGFGSALATVQLHFAIEVLGSSRYQLHVFHGSPAHWDWWKTGFGIIGTDLTLDRAKEIIDTLTGRLGSYQFFNIVSREGSFCDPIKLTEPASLDEACRVSPEA